MTKPKYPPGPRNSDHTFRHIAGVIRAQQHLADRSGDPTLSFFSPENMNKRNQQRQIEPPTYLIHGLFFITSQPYTAHKHKSLTPLQATQFDLWLVAPKRIPKPLAHTTNANSHNRAHYERIWRHTLDPNSPNNSPSPYPDLAVPGMIRHHSTHATYEQALNTAHDQ